MFTDGCVAASTHVVECGSNDSEAVSTAGAVTPNDGIAASTVVSTAGTLTTSNMEPVGTQAPVSALPQALQENETASASKLPATPKEGNQPAVP